MNNMFVDLAHSNADNVAGLRKLSVCSGRVDSDLSYSVCS